MSFSVVSSPAYSSSALGCGRRAAAAAPAPFSVSRPSRRGTCIVAYRGSDRKSGGGATSTKPQKQKQRVLLTPNAPRNEKENKESVVIFVAIASLFLSGVLFTFPALLGGAPATTKPMMKAINKSIGVEKYMVPDDGLKEGPGPAAAPGTAATMQ